jgi:two-component system sensor histidine kinase/response regulator
MIGFRFKSLQTRLILLGTLSVTIALVTACAGFIWMGLRTLHEAKRRQLQTEAEIVGFNSAAVLLIGDSQAGKQLLAPLSVQPTIAAAALYSDDGSLLADFTARGAHAAPSNAPALVGHVRNDVGELEYVVDVIEDGQRVGKLYLRADTQDLWQQVWEQVAVTLVVIAASLGVALPLAFVLARAISRPILQLAHTADHVTRHGDFTVRVENKTSGEIGALYRAFNDMLKHVDASDRALKASQDELEERVEIRTAELREQILQRERIQQDLIAAKDAAEAGSRAKSEFLANMSHEIRTPMNGVLGLTELVLDTDLSRDQRDSMEMVKSSAESLMTVINDILDFSKIEAGKLELDPVNFSLRDVVEDMLKGLALRAHRKGLELGCEIHPDVPEHVIGDPGRLRQVLINLVGNAIKFTEHGEVIVEVRNAACGMQSAEVQPGATAGNLNSESCALNFSVRDTGIGIPAEKHRVIFEAFSQADGSMTRKYGGTGLGLTISSQLVSLMGGQLRVQSAVGQGSTFHFEAVLGRPSTTTRSLAKTEFHLSGLAVLIVDDNATNRRILEGMLGKWGARPVSVDSASAALAEIQRAASSGKSYSLLLVDVMMPEMDGFTLIEKMRQSMDVERPVIMMLSSADGLGDGERCRELGIASYMIKPIRAAELRGAIIKLLDQQLAANLRPHAPSEQRDVVAVHDVPPLRILLAEDNPVNQRVAFRLLTKQGHSVVVVGNGREALAALADATFDVVLMDVQMPEMDGFEATRAIRLEETIDGRHQPIIAMTAHAMKGDRERCLAEGMDDYVTKPIDSRQLGSVIDRTIQRSQSRVNVERLQSSDSSTCEKSITKNIEPLAVSSDVPLAVLDLAALQARVEGDLELLVELSELFLNTSPAQLEEIQTAISDGDNYTIERAAHSLKGAARNLAADPCAEAAFALELAGRSGDLSETNQLLATLRVELDRLHSALHRANKEAGVCHRQS